MTVIADVRNEGTVSGAFDIERVRADFPILAETVYGKPLVYRTNDFADNITNTFNHDFNFVIRMRDINYT